MQTEETIAAYLHNYGISCGKYDEQIKWLQKAVNAGADINYNIDLERLYRLAGNEKSALETFGTYVSKIDNKSELNNLTEQLKQLLKNDLSRYIFNKLIILADGGDANAAYEVANHYRKGEIIGESKRTSSTSVNYPYLKIEKNWGKAVKYYTIAYEGNFSKGLAACNISGLY